MIKLSSLIVICILIITESEIVRSWSYNPFCMFEECCNTDYIPADITELHIKLSNRVYGQPLTEMVAHAISSHWDQNAKSRKALTFSFHGWAGSGKNYVSNFVAESLYKLGTKSKFVHYFVGRIHFPLEKDVPTYRDKLYSWLKGNISACPKQLFIFDEMEKMPPGVLNAIKPILDYRDVVDGADYTKAIFIFMSNIGAELINQQYQSYWQSGKRREDLELNDFEDLVMQGAFNAQGGFYHSDAIKSNLIDHYIPFLPMEVEHVKKCINDQFRERNVHSVKNEHIQEVLDFVQWGPKDLQIFAKSGCKRISAKVSVIVAKHYRSIKPEGSQEL